MENTTLVFNGNSYIFKLNSVTGTYNGIIRKYGSVIINGSVEYVLEYSYDSNSDDDRALYEVFNVDDTDSSFYKQYGTQGFPFYMVQSMVSHIMKKKQ
jgi:hypothetical protein